MRDYGIGIAFNWGFCSYAALAENRLRKLNTDQQAPSATASTAASSAPSASAFDGHWTVSLVCEDVRDREKFVQGYTYNFFIDVREGRLNGQRGQAGQPTFLTMTGAIQADGSAEISASGLTGNADYTVGRVRSSTPYSYRMRGTFTPASGKATRIELRPCEATFSKN